MATPTPGRDGGGAVRVLSQPPAGRGVPIPNRDRGLSV